MSERLVFNYGTTGSDTPRLGANRPPRAQAAAAAPLAFPEPRRDWAFLGLMTFTAVLFFRPQDMLTFLRPFHLAEMAALAALAGLAYDRMSKGLTISRITPELIGVLAMGFVILATAPFSVWMGGAIWTFNDMFMKVMLIFILMVNTLTSPRRIEQFTWVIVVAMGYIAFRAVFDYARGVNLIENGRVQGAVGGIFKNPNDLALNIIAVMPLAASLALRPGRPGRRMFAALTVLFMIAATVATGSRSGFIGLGLMFLIFAVRLIKHSPGLVFAGFIVAAMSLPFLPQTYLTRISSITNPSKDDTGSREARRILLREAYQTFLTHPLTGVGAGQFKNYNPEGREEMWRETHNAVLQVAAELGIGGLVVFAFLIARGFMGPLQTRRLLRHGTGARGRPGDAILVTSAERTALDVHQVAMSASMAGWFTCALFASVAYHWTFYYMLALAVAPREVLIDRMNADAKARKRASTRMLAAEARA